MKSRDCATGEQSVKFGNDCGKVKERPVNERIRRLSTLSFYQLLGENMATRKKKQPEKVPSVYGGNKPPKPDPQIPHEILLTFLEDKLKLDDGNYTVHDGFLFAEDKMERHRIDVWEKQATDYFTSSHTIKFSYFLHYDTKTQTITDCTVTPDPLTSRTY